MFARLINRIILEVNLRKIKDNHVKTLLRSYHNELVKNVKPRLKSTLRSQQDILDTYIAPTYSRKFYLEKGKIKDNNFSEETEFYTTRQFEHLRVDDKGLYGLKTSKNYILYGIITNTIYNRNRAYNLLNQNKEDIKQLQPLKSSDNFDRALYNIYYQNYMSKLNGIFWESPNKLDLKEEYIKKPLKSIQQVKNI